MQGTDNYIECHDFTLPLQQETKTVKQRSDTLSCIVLHKSIFSPLLCMQH